MLQVSEHFVLAEFVPPYLINRFGPKALWYVSRFQIQAAEAVRTYFDAPVTINNYHLGGRFENRGTRLPNSKVGAWLSQHKYANAIDVSVKGLSAHEVYRAILDDQTFFMRAGVTTLEDVRYTPTWLHLDGRSTGMSDIYIVKP